MPKNILWIMTDQQFAGAMHCTGNDELHTPAMDSIAARGVRFDSAYCTNPLCLPSRSSMMTGLYPHELGVNGNAHNHDMPGTSLGTRFQELGYTTAYYGKWHISRPPTDKDWHGFSEIEFAEGNGRDPYVADACCRFLNQAPKDEPWLLVASYHNPHDICEWARMAAGIDDRLPNGPIEATPPAEQCPPLLPNFGIPSEPSVIRAYQTMEKLYRTYPVKDWTEDQWRQYRWAYNRLVEKVDAEIQKILDHLETTGQLENTVILFTSDHGDGMGAHQWNQKTLFYEECARVPFIIAGPEIETPGRVDSDTLVSVGIDLGPTLLDFAEAPVKEPCHGISLKPVVEKGVQEEKHDYVVCEDSLMLKNDHSDGIYGRMLRTSRYKYIVYSQGEAPEQLFDIKEDPGELNNLAYLDEHQVTLEEHRSLLKHHMTKTNDSFTADCL